LNASLAYTCADVTDGYRDVRSVAGAERVPLTAAEPLDLPDGDNAPVCCVALDPDAPLPVPAAKRVETDPERAGGVARRGAHCSAFRSMAASRA
jgi:hypothetical protein